MNNAGPSSVVQFVRRGASKATSPSKIDAEICVLLGTEPHPERYVANWFGKFGQMLSFGETYDGIENRIRTEVAESEDEEEAEYYRAQLTALDHLKKNYVPYFGFDFT
jgi:hypothetical protein